MNLQQKIYITEFVNQNVNNLNILVNEITRPKDNKNGDWSLAVFNLGKKLGKNPALLAKEITDQIKDKIPSGIEKIENAGPYLNFFLDRKYWNYQSIKNILLAKDDVGKKQLKQKTSIVLEYSSPNIAKTIHIGHLRTTLIGACLDRVLRYQGFDVVSVNHLGDWGTQFGFVFAGCQLYGQPQNPTVDELVEIYIKATNLRKLQDQGQEKDKPDVNQIAKDYFIKLESGDKSALDFWQWCLEISLDYLKKIYQRLGICFDHYTGESFYKDMVLEIETMVKDAGILEESEGALGVNLGKELGFVRIFAEDGRSLYITRDIAAAIYRHNTFKPEKNLYVVAHQQTLHFKQLKGVLEKMNHPSAQEVTHIPFGFVPGMKTREGGAISLKLFLDEAYEKALLAYHNQVEKKSDLQPDNQQEFSKIIAEKVAIGATYFYFLSHSNIKDFYFNWDEALSFQGDTGPYCQYALARLNSIIDKAKLAGLEVDAESFSIELAKYLVDEQSHKLVNLLSSFEDILSDVVRTYEPNILAEYILKITHNFSSAYKHLRVLNEDNIDLAKARLALFIATRNVLKKALWLLGVPPVERM